MSVTLGPEGAWELKQQKQLRRTLQLELSKLYFVTLTGQLHVIF